MDASSERSPNTSSPTPERASGFFIRHLPRSVLGRQWDPLTSALVAAQPWVSPQLLGEALRTQLAARFRAGGRIPHVFLRTPLRPPVALALHGALAEATFQPHHHAAYPLQIAPLALQRPSPLTAFMRWLASREGARFHTHLVGLDAAAPPVKVQVQTSRMRVGERFPPHIDTNAEGLAVVYNLTSPWEERFGGQLEFPAPGSDVAELSVPVLFNSVVLFRPAGALHRVLPVTEAAGDHLRHTVTAFYCYSPER